MEGSKAEPESLRSCSQSLERRSTSEAGGKSSCWERGGRAGGVALTQGEGAVSSLVV